VSSGSPQTPTGTINSNDHNRAYISHLGTYVSGSINAALIPYGINGFFLTHTQAIQFIELWHQICHIIMELAGVTIIIYFKGSFYSFPNTPSAKGDGARNENVDSIESALYYSCSLCVIWNLKKQIIFLLANILEISRQRPCNWPISFQYEIG